MTKLPEKIEAGQELDVQIAPFGEWMCHDDIPRNKGLVQVIDEAAVDRMVANFDEEILVDIDHKSFDKGETEAAAWITRLFKDPEKGLMARFKFTPLGAAAVTERRYRFTSPVWLYNASKEIVKVQSVALTNTPNLPVFPVLNARRDAQDGNTPLQNAVKRLQNAPNNSDGKTTAFPSKAPEGRFSQDFTTPSNTPKKERNPEMEEIKTALGLPPEATDAETLSAIKALKDKIDELEKAKAEAEATEFAAANANKGIDREVLKNSYLAAPQVAKNMVAGLKSVVTPPAEPVCAAKNAIAPSANGGADVLAGLQACKNSAERIAYIRSNVKTLTAIDTGK